MSFVFSCLLCLHYILSISAQTQIAYDAMTTNANNWNYGGNSVIPSTAPGCPVSTGCFELRNTGWVERTFSTKGYQDVYFQLYIHGDKAGRIDIYVYDNTLQLSWISYSFTNTDALNDIHPSTPNIWDNIDSLKIRFEFNGQSNKVYMDSFRLYGNPTSAPTTSSNPTNYPTKYPTATVTSYPTKYPTITSANPTNYPTYSTSIPTTKPTLVPTLTPTPSPTGCYPRGPCDIGYMDKTNGNYHHWACGSVCVGSSGSGSASGYTDTGCVCACIPDTSCAPTTSPTINTQQPTSYPSILPSINPTKNPTINPTIQPTNIPSINPTYQPTNIPTSTPTDSVNPSKTPSQYPTAAPTQRKSDGAVDESDDNLMSTTIDIDHRNNDTKTSTATQHSYFLIGGLAVLFLIITTICVIILLYKIKKKINEKNKSIKKQNIEEIMSASSGPDTTFGVTDVQSHITNESEIEMQQFSLPSTHVQSLSTSTMMVTPGMLEHNNIQMHSQMNSIASMHAMSMRQLMGESELKLDVINATSNGGEQVNNIDDIYDTPTDTHTPEDIDDDDDGLYENTDEYEDDKETKGNTLGGTAGGNEIQQVNTDSENTNDDDTNDENEYYYEDDNTDKGVKENNENVNENKGNVNENVDQNVNFTPQ